MGWDVREIVVRYPGGIRELYFLQNVEAGCTPYSMRTEKKRLGLKTDSLCSFGAEAKNELIVDLYLPIPRVPSWRRRA